MAQQPIETIDYNGFRIEIHPDLGAENPHEWETLTPMLVCTRRGIQAYGDIDTSPPTISADQIRECAADIAEILGGRTLLEGVRNWVRLRDYNHADSAVDDALADAVQSMIPSDRLDALATLYRIAGIPSVCVARNGYTQGAWATILAVATPQYLEHTGLSLGSVERQLIADVDLFAAWLHGDVYGYRVMQRCPCCGQYSPVYSEWGFYGAPDNSGLIDAAKEWIDSQLDK
ncbi:MAG: hypothetical protein D6800_10600 [Candidatus Zixiibacteriota bacterium]|nr:MAG: hypothetical protein D6800_10600 [candidate division Zixibacteria bacterium]